MTHEETAEGIAAAIRGLRCEGEEGDAFWISVAAPVIARALNVAYGDGLRKARHLAKRHGASFEFFDALDRARSRSTQGEGK